MSAYIRKDEKKTQIICVHINEIINDWCLCVFGPGVLTRRFPLTPSAHTQINVSPGPPTSRHAEIFTVYVPRTLREDPRGAKPRTGLPNLFANSFAPNVTLIHTRHTRHDYTPTENDARYRHGVPLDLAVAQQITCSIGIQWNPALHRLPEGHQTRPATCHQRKVDHDNGFGQKPDRGLCADNIGQHGEYNEFKHKYLHGGWGYCISMSYYCARAYAIDQLSSVRWQSK